MSRYIPYNYHCLLLGGGDIDGSSSLRSSSSRTTSRDLRREILTYDYVTLRCVRQTLSSTFLTRRVARRTSDGGTLNSLRFLAPPIRNVWNVIPGFAVKCTRKHPFVCQCDIIEWLALKMTTGGWVAYLLL